MGIRVEPPLISAHPERSKSKYTRRERCVRAVHRHK
jgi:hypothetical protein